jgi:hypothetical protein
MRELYAATSRLFKGLLNRYFLNSGISICLLSASTYRVHIKFIFEIVIRPAGLRIVFSFKTKCQKIDSIAIESWHPHPGAIPCYEDIELHLEAKVSSTNLYRSLDYIGSRTRKLHQALTRRGEIDMI